MASDMYAYPSEHGHHPDDRFDEGVRYATPVYGQAAVEGYSRDILHGFDKEPTTQTNPPRPQSSALVDLKDPVQVHLLTETALSDSKLYTILAPEEVDHLKKLIHYLHQRIDSTRQNLAVQTKYRDAAVSMHRLYSHARSDSNNRPSVRSSRSSGSEQQRRDAEHERQTCERKCQELATELFSLEKRLMEPQQRLLEHTAAILQWTHKPSGTKQGDAPGALVNGIPGSPESMQTFSRDYDQDSFEAYFEEAGSRGLAHAAPATEVSPLEIPLKSPSRMEQTQRRDDNNALVTAVHDMERQFEDLNMAVRETIVRFNPAVNGDYDEPPYMRADQDAKPGEMLRHHMDYLQSGLVAIQAEQESTPAAAPAPLGLSLGPDPATETVLTGLWASIQTGLADMRQRRLERKRAMQEKGLSDQDEHSEDDDFDTDEKYTLTGLDTRVRWLQRQATTLKDQKSVLKRQIKQQRELNNKSDAEKDEELARKQEELEQSRVLVSRAEKDAMDAQKMLSEALEDLEAAQTAANEGARHGARAAETDAEVEDLRSQVAALQSHVEASQAQLQQARANDEAAEDNAKRLAALDSHITALDTQLQQVSAAYEKSEAHVQDLMVQLETKAATYEKQEAQVRELAAQLEAKTTAHERLEAHVQDLTTQLESKAAMHEKYEAQTRELAAQMEAKTAALSAKEAEADELNVAMAELKTEVTLARAELDGAYGSRAERAADVAAKQNAAEAERLQQQVARLKAELEETVSELEEITKETISAEREKQELEGKLDEALADRGTLESDLEEMRARMEGEVGRLRDKMGRLQEELDGERLKTPGGGVRAGAGASVLSEQFRTTMREERKKFQEDIREERARNRRLEDELAKLKRAQGPGKSPLSPRVPS